MARATKPELAREARLLGRYLLLEEPADSVVDAYVDGCALLFDEGEDPRRDPLVSLAMRRPALLPLLDGAVAWRGADEPLRRKLLLMLAVAEASPEHTGAFLSEPSETTVREVAVELAAAALKGALGLALLRAMGR